MTEEDVFAGVVRYTLEHGSVAQVVHAARFVECGGERLSGVFFYLSNGAIEASDHSGLRWSELPKVVQEKIREKFMVVFKINPKDRSEWLLGQTQDIVTCKGVWCE